MCTFDSVNQGEFKTGSTESSLPHDLGRSARQRSADLLGKGDELPMSRQSLEAGLDQPACTFVIVPKSADSCLHEIRFGAGQRRMGCDAVVARLAANPPALVRARSIRRHFGRGCDLANG